MARIKRALRAVVYGPWNRAALQKVHTTEGLLIYEEEDFLSNPVTRSSTVHFARGYQASHYADKNAIVYEGDPVYIFADEPAKQPKDTTKAQFKVRIGNRVLAIVPSELADTHDTPGHTWRGLTTDAINFVHNYLANAPKTAPDALRTFEYLTLPEPDVDGVPATGSVQAKVDGKFVKVDPSFFDSPDLAAALNRAHPKLRNGMLAPAPSISAVEREDYGTPGVPESYWQADINMEWQVVPPARVVEDVPCVWLDDGAQYWVYPESVANDIVATYEAARDAHNVKLEDALLGASKGNAMTAEKEAELRTRPDGTQHNLVKQEADEWWNKSNNLVTQIKKVPEVDGVTDSNLATKYPKGAAGKTIEELDAYVKQQRADGNVEPTKDVINAIPKPAGHKEDQPWWSRVLDTVDGFGAGTKEVLKDWGPMGTVGAYGGVKAINTVSRASPWLWVAIAGAAILLLK